MSDRPRNWRTEGDQSGPRGDSTGPSDGVSDADRSPLRTRRDPVTGPGGRVRPPSTEPSWAAEPARRRRGTGRYAAPTTDLPPAVIPDGAPGWMGQTRDQRDSGRRREPINPQPLGGAVRRAEDYATGWPARSGESPGGRNASTGTWPSQPTRPARDQDGKPSEDVRDATALRDSDEDDALADAEFDSNQTRPHGAGRSSATGRLPRRTGIALFEDPMASGFSLLVAVSAAVMWGLTRYLIDSVPDPLTLRLRADGSPGTIAGAGAIWQVPFVATMLGLMSIGAALLVARRDQFAARFVVGMGVLVQGLIWVAAITLLR